MTRIILGLSGPSRIGKSWLSNQLVANGERSWAIVETSLLVWDEIREIHKGYGPDKDEFIRFKEGLHGTSAGQTVTGRQIIIDFIENHLAATERKWLAQQVMRRIAVESTPNVIIDCIGRTEEYAEYMRAFAPADDSDRPHYIHLAIAPDHWRHLDKLDDNYRDFIDPPGNPLSHRFATSDEAWAWCRLNSY